MVHFYHFLYGSYFSQSLWRNRFFYLFKHRNCSHANATVFVMDIIWWMIMFFCFDFLLNIFFFGLSFKFLPTSISLFICFNQSLAKLSCESSDVFSIRADNFMSFDVIFVNDMDPIILAVCEIVANFFLVLAPIKMKDKFFFVKNMAWVIWAWSFLWHTIKVHHFWCFSIIITNFKNHKTLPNKLWKRLIWRLLTFLRWSRALRILDAHDNQ